MQVCTAMGCSAGFASAPVSGKQLRAVAIQGSLSLALALGQAVQQAQRIKADPVAAAVTAANGKLVFKGATLLSVTVITCSRLQQAPALVAFAVNSAVACCHSVHLQAWTDDACMSVSCHAV